MFFIIINNEYYFIFMLVYFDNKIIEINKLFF